jgi:DNA invertase Pin-like site-specific DNA recombinase/predicted  nucleic acid-binding Zn-ribbon protein
MAEAEMAIPRVIISVRVSSEAQQEQGFGHANQLRRLPELVQEQGWEIAKRPDGSPGIYDEGHASTTAAAGADLSLESRPVMQMLLAELAVVQPTYLVCRDQDRLHRSSLEWELLQHQMVKAGVEAVVQWPNLQGAPIITRLSESKDRAFASIQAAFSSLQKADMKTKLMAGRRERTAQGLPNGGHAPYGYERATRTTRGERPRPFAINKAEAETYGQMIQWTIEGHGSAWIAHRLNRLGVPTRKGRGGWSAPTVRHIIASQAPSGMMRVHNEWQPAQGQPAIISRELWEQAQAALAPRRRPGAGTVNKRRHALAGLLRCSACGKTMKARVHRRSRIEPKTGKAKHYEYWFYTCKIYGSGCSEGCSINERRALRELAEHIDEALSSTTNWIQAAPASNVGEVEQRISDLEADLADAKRKLKRAHTAYVDAEDDMASIALEELHHRRARVKSIESELGEARRGYATAMTAPSDAVDLDELKALLADWDTFEDNDKRALIETVIDYAVVRPPGRKDRLEIHWADVPCSPNAVTEP